MFEQIQELVEKKIAADTKAFELQSAFIGSVTKRQGAFVSEQEVREVCDHLREHGKPEFLEDLVQMKGGGGGGGEVDDPLYADACRIILQSGRGSASLLHAEAMRM